MTPPTFNVTQVRLAASCPRLFWFDLAAARRSGTSAGSTRVWKAADPDAAAATVTACGTLFHAAVEKLHDRGAADPNLAQLLCKSADPAALASGLTNFVYFHGVDQDALFQRTGAEQAAFMAALNTYTTELADLLVHAVAAGQSPEEALADLFGDARRDLVVHFTVGPGSRTVRVRGRLDHVYFDRRFGSHRILEFKLTPARQPANDTVQAVLYALMHDRLHGTRPGTAVVYLHPRREVVSLPWDEVQANEGRLLDLLASMSAWAVYDEAASRGMKPPGEPGYCPVCPHALECEPRLGPKDEGERVVRPTPDPAAVGSSLLLGKTEEGADVLMPPAALATHLAVVGAAGSGKTWLAKVLAEEAILQGVPVLAIDPQGDLVQFLRPADPASLPADLRARHRLYWDRVEPRVLTPGSSHGVRVNLSPLRLVSDQDLGALPQVRRQEERDALLATVAGNLVSLARAGGEVDSQHTFLLQVLRRLSIRRQSLGLEELAAAVHEPEAAGLDDADSFIRKAERERLARKLKGLTHGPAAALFTGGRSLDLDELRRPGTPGRVPLNVVYLNHLPGDEQKQAFVAALAAEVYRWMITRGGQDLSLLFYLDEARDYLPAGTKQVPAKNPLLRLLAQGRKYGVAFQLCTQSPRSVDYNAFTNCSTKLVGRLESSQDVERVGQWFGTGGPAPEWLAGRKGAAKGTFVGRWPEMAAPLEGRPWTSRRLFSLHQGAWSPDRVEQEVHGPAIAR